MNPISINKRFFVNIFRAMRNDATLDIAVDNYVLLSIEWPNRNMRLENGDMAQKVPFGVFFSFVTSIFINAYLYDGDFFSEIPTMNLCENNSICGSDSHVQFPPKLIVLIDIRIVRLFYTKNINTNNRTIQIAIIGCKNRQIHIIFDVLVGCWLTHTVYGFWIHPAYYNTSHPNCKATVWHSVNISRSILFHCCMFHWQ